MNKLAPLQTRLFSSRIAKTMVACFIALAMLEGVLLAGLSYLVVQADRQASHKFAQLQALTLISQIMQSSVNLFYSVERNMSDKSYRTDVPIWSQQLEDQTEHIGPALVTANFDAAFLGQIKSFCSIINNSAKKAYELRFVQRAYNASAMLETKDLCLKAAMQLLDAWKNTGPEVEAALAANSNKKYNAAALLNISILLNLVGLAGLLYLVNRGIVEPIRQLTKSCSRLHLATKMLEPATVRNEVGSLQKSFFELSRTIHQNEQQKRLHANMLSTAQTLSLQNLSNCFSQLKSIFPNSNKKASARIDATLISIKRLQNSISSLVETMGSATSLTNDLELTQCSVNHLIDSSVSICDSLAARSEVSIKIHIEPQISQHEITVDEQKIIRVLVNLLSNAIKFSPKGSTIEISATEAANKHVLIAVKDHGPGIAESELSQLFQPFKQTTAARALKVSGTGLGLSSSKETIESHGGKIGCDSILGAGATFWFELAQHQEAQQRQLITQTPEPRNIKFGGLRATVVVMMLAFIIPQSVLFISLSNKLNQVNEQSAEFELQKSRFLAMQDLLFRYCSWRKDMHGVTLQHNIGNATGMLRTLKDVLDRTKLAYKDASNDETLRAQLKALINGQYAFGRVLKDATQDIFRAQPGAAVYEEASRRSFTVLTQMIGILSSLSSNAASSYTLGNSLRSEILSITAIAALFDLVMLMTLTLIGLKITDRISTLKEKADRFALGEIPVRTLKGTDELSFLDAEFVDACTAIAEAQAQKRMLLAAINHDLRSPLTSIQVTIESFREGIFGILPEPAEELVKTSETETKKLLTRINNLLTLEKIDAGALNPELQTFFIIDLVNALIAETQWRMESKSVPITVETTQQQEISVVADPNLIKLMLAELLDNALNAAPSGTTIIIRLEERDKLCRVEIENGGHSIDDDRLPTIFERVQTTSGEATLALGLPLAKRIADLNNGTIQVARTQAAKTLVTVNLQTEMMPLELVAQPGNTV